MLSTKTSMEGGVMTRSAPAATQRTQSFRDSFCNLEPTQLRIPRPNFTGMEFVQTRGRQGYYLSTRRKDPWGTNPQPRRPLLSDITFHQDPIQESADPVSSKSPSSTASSDSGSTKDSRTSSESLTSNDSSEQTAASATVGTRMGNNKREWGYQYLGNKGNNGQKQLPVSQRF